MYSRRDRATNKTAQICWHFGGGEKHFAEEVAGLLRERGLNPFVTELFCANATFGPSTTWTVRCRSMWLYELFDRLGIGRGAKGKRAPDLSVALVPDLVGGWLDGDGSAHAGGIRGYSESRLMVRDMWRLLAKAGILGAVDNDGRCLNISMQSDAKTVAGWTKRLRINRLYKQSPRISRDWRRVDLGWMVRVKHIARVKRATNVASIETVSGRYIANDVLTHNCLGVNEAASLGMPILMPAIDPQVRFLPGRTLIPPRTPSRKIQVMNPIHLYETYPHELAARIAELARRPEEVAALSRASDRYAESISWDRLKPLYVSTFERVCNGERLGVAA